MTADIKMTQLQHFSYDLIRLIKLITNDTNIEQFQIGIKSYEICFRNRYKIT